MNPGKMDRLIRIQNRIVETNPFGEEIESWEDAAAVWAEVIPVRGSEYFSARQAIAQVDVKFRIRYRTDLSVKDRIAYEGKYYDIQSIIEVGRREGLEIMAAARAE